MVNTNWLNIPGFPGYQVSSCGRVRSLKRGRVCVLKEKMKPDGYRMVRFSLGSRESARTLYVHVVVASVFIGPCPDGFQVDHRNGKRDDNRASNLRYLPPAENSRRSSATKLKGKILAIKKRLADGESQQSIADSYGVNQTAISKINIGKTWQG